MGRGVLMNPAGVTDTGKHRANNEDAFFLGGTGFQKLPTRFIVAAGMGGHNAGEVASSEAISFFKQFCVKTPLKKKEILDYLIAGCVYANNGVYDMSEKNISYNGMGTTFSLCVKDSGRLYIAHIGDSRIYAVYDDGMKLLTADHTYVFEMLKLGQIDEQQARTHPKRNMLIRVLGVDRDVKIDGQVFELAGCRKVLLCTDGLTNMLSDEEIFNHIQGENAAIADKLVERALKNGGADNITLILFDAGG